MRAKQSFWLGVKRRGLTHLDDCPKETIVMARSTGRIRQLPNLSIRHQAIRLHGALPRELPIFARSPTACYPESIATNIRSCVSDW